MPRGGFRPGAGRPTGSENAETKKKRAIRKMIVDFAYENRHELLEELKKDRMGIRYVLDQAIGKPIESVQISEAQQNPYIVEVKCLENSKYESSGPRNVPGQI